MRRAIQIGAVAVAALVVLGSLAACGDARRTEPGPDAGATGPGTGTYLQFNLCGNACSDGALGVVDVLIRAVRERSPDAVTLNELCENQADHLRTELSGYQVRFDPTGPRCWNGNRYGNAILVRATTVELVGSWELPEPVRNETRRLMCLRTPTGLVVCVTHVSNVDANIGPQLDEIARIMSTVETDGPVLLGGDFNTDPHDARLDALYRSCDRAGGRYQEADSPGCGRHPTVGQTTETDVLNEDTYSEHKYDYVFLSDGDWTEVRADAAVLAEGVSDHDALWVTARTTR